MNVLIHSNSDAANDAAANLLATWLTSPATRTLMVAAGNTPLNLYQRIGARSLSLAQLQVFALDEYVGVPLAEPRNCANLLRRSVAEAWRIPVESFFAVSSVATEALASVQAHERRIAEAGGLDIVVLGLGQNGHLGFNEPGSPADSVGRLIELEPSSIEANRQWFGGKYAPARGVTVGLRTILAARQILLLAFGGHKTTAAQALIEAPPSEQCPASFLQGQANAWVFLDEAAAAGLKPETRRRFGS